MKQLEQHPGPAADSWRRRLCAGAIVALVVLAVLVAPGPRALAFSRATVRQIDASAAGYLHYSLGRLMEIEGLLAESLVQYRRAHSLNPGDCALPTAVARVLQAMGRLDDALEQVRIARQQCPDAEEPLEIEAEVLILLGRPDEAEAVLVSSIGSGVPTSVGPGRVSTRIVALLGQSLEVQGRLEEAGYLYSARSAVDTLDAEMAFLHGRASLLLDNVEVAVTELRRSHRLQPRNRTAAAMLARLLDSLDRLDEALPVLETFVQYGEATAAEHILLARAYALSGRSGRAHVVLDDASRIWGETQPLMATRASVYYASGEPDSAVAVYHRILELNPSSLLSLNSLAYHYAERGEQLDEALALALRAQELAPENPFVSDTLGWVYFRLEQYDNALRELTRAVELGADQAVVLEHLGDACDALGRRVEARDAWTRALELDPARLSTQQRLNHHDDDSNNHRP
ncbi:tetratricopeptide repeat protein [bacterium]|nr:tetratricopeptide repeat protein [bacterium]